MKFFRFYRTLLVIANNIHRHIEGLLFSTSFVISVLFGDVKTEKLAHSVSPADKISLDFPNIKIARVFWLKEKDLLPLFHKMLECLELYIWVVYIKVKNNLCTTVAIEIGIEC